MIVGVDAGNYQVKVVSHKGVDIFPSDIGEYRKRNLEQKFSANDMAVEYQGKKYFAGTLAQYESEFAGSMMGDSKAHTDCLLRVLLALHRLGGVGYQIIVGQPIGMHTQLEKMKIKHMLASKHTITINHMRREFTIDKVEVAAEGGAAFWSAPEDGLVRVVDVGSGTINCATLHDRRYVDKDSFTLLLGANTTKTKNYHAMARSIAVEVCKKWNKYDRIKVAGGVACVVLPHLQEHLPNTTLLQPQLNGNTLEPVYGNAVGFYRIGREIYGDS